MNTDIINRIQKIQINNQEILVIDYSGLREDQMIELGDLALAQALADNARFRLLSIFNERNYLTPRVMNHQRKILKQAIHLADKVAIIGLNPIKKIILNGINSIMGSDFKSFATREEALAYLSAD
jgi:hypothetical protein